MKLTRWTVALYMGLVFLCGGVAGAFAFRLYTVSAVSANVSRRNPEAFRKRFLAELKVRLNLSEDQMSKMGVIMEETGRRFREARSTIEPDIKKIREEQRQQISEILNPEQRQEWVKIVEERDRERENKRRATPAAPGK
jgi:uncharacterized membrane protein